MMSCFIHNESCMATMQRLQGGVIDLVVTSPPYDNLRNYNQTLDGWGDRDWKPVIKELYRVVEKGGVVVWVVGDATHNGSESGSSFKQALYAMECGFNLHDTMVFEKNSSTFPARKTGNRYTQIFEYMFVFSKGKPKTSNLICDKKNKWAGFKDYSGKLKNPVPEYSPRTNIWKYTTSKNSTGHPAPFPLDMAKDCIKSWSKESDTVYDPFSGSGTTAVACSELGRDFIGSETVPEYYEKSLERINKELTK